MTSETTGHAHHCWQCDLVIERGEFDCDLDEDHDFADCEYCITEEIVSATFRRCYEEHPDRGEDPALAIDSAQETAAQRIPPGMTGTFDDVTLTFTADRPDRPRGAPGRQA